MDGILVDSEPCWREVEAAVFDQLGVDVRPFLGHGQTMGLRVDEAIGYLADCVGLERPDLVAIEGTVIAGVVRAITEEASLLPGAIAAIHACSAAGLRVALASGSTPPVIDAVLDRFALRALFDGVFSAIDDPYGKPHPSIFLRAAAALGVEATECVVVEDSLNGCVAAKAARMAVIAIPHPDDASDPRYAIADLRCSSLDELVSGAAAQLVGIEPEAVTAH